MNCFSVFNYNNLSETQKEKFDRGLANQLSLLLKEIKRDNDLGNLDVVNFITCDGVCDVSASFVPNLFSMVSAGVQAGSGNQNLYLNILSAITESWNDIIKSER